jgi:hypothetical protein
MKDYHNIRGKPLPYNDRNLKIKAEICRYGSVAFYQLIVYAFRGGNQRLYRPPVRYIEFPRITKKIFSLTDMEVKEVPTRKVIHKKYFANQTESRMWYYFRDRIGWSVKLGQDYPELNNLIRDMYLVMQETHQKNRAMRLYLMQLQPRFEKCRVAIMEFLNRYLPTIVENPPPLDIIEALELLDQVKGEMTTPILKKERDALFRKYPQIRTIIAKLRLYKLKKIILGKEDFMDEPMTMVEERPI